MKRTCQECRTEFRGRADKKFCTDYCRNAYNNRVNQYSNATIKRINYGLKRNRRILEELNPNGKAKVHGSRLRSKGFDFELLTSYQRTKTGKTYVFCYEQGYMPMDNDFFTLVKREE